MWIVDVQLPLDGSESISTGSKSISLKEGATYTIGRSADCDIVLNLKKVSRLQTEIQVLDDQHLKLSNKGHATWVYGPGKELKGGCNDSLVLTKRTVLKLRSSDWKFELFKVDTLQVSPLLKKKLHNIEFIHASSELRDFNSVFLNGELRYIKDPETWIKKLNSKDWERTGGLAKLIIPDTESEKPIINIDDDFNEGGQKVLVPTTKKKGTDFETVDIKPFHSQLTYREAKRSRKSQLERMFDEMDDMDDLETYTSQSIQKNEVNEIPSTIITNSLKKPNTTSINLQTVNKDLSRLDLKRSLTPEETAIPSKKPKLSSTPTLPPSNDHLAEVFKKTKQMKMEKISEEEKLLNSIQKKENDPNVIKIKRFQVNLHGGSNPKLYSNYRMAYGSDPRWENRLNYSKFVKTTNGSDYNPIMDSTIKTVKFKNSNYRSNELQVNLNQNDDIIPELDSMFGDTTTTSAPPVQFSGHKRRRDTMLFVDSDEEDSLAIHTHEPNRGNSAFDDENRNVSAVGMSFGNTFSNDHPNLHDSYQIHNDDDDTPVFKSRRR